MAVFASAINPLMSIINQALTNFLSGLGNYGIILGVVAGGMMSIDMGGPFNKAAYVTATGLLASGNYILMAAVMAGGLSVAFNCQLRAPHGGVFVFATVSNWSLYLLAIAAGSVVGCLILSTLKKSK